MANERLKFDSYLRGLYPQLPIYYQPPENLKLTYPCVIYKLTNIKETYADDLRYSNIRHYSVTIIDRNPDSEYPDRLSNTRYCSFDRSYASENLHHFVFSVYY